MALTKLNNQAIASLTDFNISTDDMPSGSVLQVVKFSSNSALNVTTSNTWVSVTPSSVTITPKQTGSTFVYVANLSVESDHNSSYNSFYRLARYVGGGSEQLLSGSARNGNAILDSNGTINDNYTHVDNGASYTLGQNIKYELQFNKSDADSSYFNQQNLGGQPSGTTNHSGGYVMEIAG